MTINSTLIISGAESLKTPFQVASGFYDRYGHDCSDASTLDIAQAIGNAKSSPVPDVASRIKLLKAAAELYRYRFEDVEHAVRILGMPIKIVQEHFESIPAIFQFVANNFSKRFHCPSGSNTFISPFTSGMKRLYRQREGFCYVVTPGNDVRAGAMVAANLCMLGIPFIIKTSREDCATRLAVAALLNAGFDSRFISLVPFNSSAPDAQAKHFKMVNAASMIWTFGSDDTVDTVLRFQTTGKRVYLDITDQTSFTGENGAVRIDKDIAVPARFAESRAIVRGEQKDHFIGKSVVRHGSGNSSMILGGYCNSALTDILYRSIGYAIGCNSAKSAFVTGDEQWEQRIAESMSNLRVGDPLHPDTDVGYIHRQTLDYLDELIGTYQLTARMYGGARLSMQQARPLLVVGSLDMTKEFFSREIPAYCLVIQYCRDLNHAIQESNRSAHAVRRLSVSVAGALLSEAQLAEIHSHTILLNRPTNDVIPIVHEGNDYQLMLSRETLIIS